MIEFCDSGTNPIPSECTGTIGDDYHVLNMAPWNWYFYLILSKTICLQRATIQVLPSLSFIILFVKGDEKNLFEK